MAIAALAAAVLLALLWTRTLSGGYLAGAVVGLAAGAVALAQAPRRLLLAAFLTTTVGVASAAWTELRLDRIRGDWTGYAAAQAVRLRADLDRRMARVFRDGDAAAERAARVARRVDGAALFSSLEGIRADAGVAAVAVFDGSGQLTAWAGEHRGVLPEQARIPERTVTYAERPLFSYLYLSAPIEDSGGNAVVIVLLQTGPPLGPGRAGGVASRFAAAAGATLRFASGGGAGADWRYPATGEAEFHAEIEPPTQAAVLDRVGTLGRRAVVALLALAFALLVAAWSRIGEGRRRRFAAPLLGAAVFLVAAPLGAVLPVPTLFSPGLFLLPTPGEITLGPLLLVLLPATALVSLLRAPPLPRRAFRVALALGAAYVAAAFALVLRAVLAGAGPTLLEGDAFLWWGLQPATMLLLTALAAFAFPRERREAAAASAGDDAGHDAGEGLGDDAGGGAASGEPWEGEEGRSSGGARAGAAPAGRAPSSWPLLAAGAFLGALLAGGLTAYWLRHVPPRRADAWPVGAAALWSLPFLLMAVGLGRRGATGGRLLRTLCAGWLAVTFALPNLWAAHEGARIAAAERSLATLGSRADPYASYLLNRFATDLREREARGDAGLDLVFRAWVASGLAQGGYPVQIILWDSAAHPTAALHLAGAPDPEPLEPATASALRSLLRRASAASLTILDAEPPIPAANQALAVPFRDGGGVTVLLPPRRALDYPPALLSFLGAPPPSGTRLSLIPSAAAGAAAPARRDISWRLTDRGWRSEATVVYPDGPYHAHLDLRVPPRVVLLARGALLAALLLALLTVLWGVARAVEGGLHRPGRGWLAWLGSFRARVSLSLFAFFLLPTIAFGAFAYRVLAGEAVRSATLLGEHAVDEAARAFPASSYLVRIGDRVGEEVLYYFRGELAQASSPEAVQLGLYGAWMPPRVYLALNTGEQVTASDAREVYQTPYVVSFRALRPAGTLAVPVSLSTGDAVARQMELMHLALFAALVGGILSFALSLYVARALARPIGRLRRAAAAVGAGHLEVRLPALRRDEFGELFSSFNRMVRRLREARSREVRTARILAWGEMARQVAHEIKNPLTPIKLSVQHLRRVYADGRADFGRILETNVEQILGEIDRLGEIARAFSRYGVPPESAGPLQRVDVAGAVREVLTLYRAGDTRIRYAEEVESDLPEAWARAGELKEVLGNLLENARSAVGEEGSIAVAAEHEDGRLELRVDDDGSGIPSELLPRVFEPHFSTRTAGTGLGLAIVRRLVESWGGEVEVESEPGRGTTVRVRMRVADGDAAVDRERGGNGGPAGGYSEAR